MAIAWLGWPDGGGKPVSEIGVSKPSTDPSRTILLLRRDDGEGGHRMVGMAGWGGEPVSEIGVSKPSTDPSRTILLLRRDDGEGGHRMVGMAGWGGEPVSECQLLGASPSAHSYSEWPPPPPALRAQGEEHE